MLLKQNLQLRRILLITWKVDLLMLGLCIAAYFVDTKLFKDVQIPPALPTLMGTAIAFFIGFNNNQAYGRWWEARTIWGELVNNSREWARNVMFYTRVPETGVADGLKHFQQKMIFRHLAFLYALQSSLRKSGSSEYKKFLSSTEAESVRNFANKPNAILDIQSRELESMAHEKMIDTVRFYKMADLIAGFGNGMGKSERIGNTVFPTVYVYFTRLFIWIFVILLTMSISEIGPWSVFFGWIMGFVFHTTHINGMSIMNPFENQAPGVPITSITRTIEIDILQTLGEKEIPVPILPVNDEYIL